MNKINAIVFVPSINKKIEVAIPIDRQIYDVINLIIKMINEIFDNDLLHNDFVLVNSISGLVYDPNIIVKDSDIRNGTNLMLI